MGARDTIPPAPATLSSDVTAHEYVFSTQDFERVRKLIYARAGINLNDSKQNMVYSRLARRLRATECNSFAEYLNALEHDAAFAAGETQEFINALTTNLTSFFRESHHFPILTEYLRAHAAQPGLRIWCAAASTGEEPYTLAMTMLEALGANTSARLLATDIDTNVLNQGKRGVYKLDAAKTCGEARLRQFFLRGKGDNEGMVRVRPEVARLIEFGQLNLLEDNWPALRSFSAQVDVVFCRNVMIYFDKSTQRSILARIAGYLKPGGLLFVGHSENFTDCRDHFHLRGKTVYQRL
jgi:chemotaxis protein methyltransferase CheR